MLIYEYWCDKCLKEFEAFVDYRDRDEAYCPECHEKMDRLFSFPRLIKVN